MTKLKKLKIPYIVTIDEGSAGEVLSIYRNYKPNDMDIQEVEYFVHYKFLPGLGFYGFGLTHMIRWFITSCNTIIKTID